MIPNDPNQHKPRDRKKVILRLGKYLLQHKWMVLAAVSLTITGNLLALLGPMLSGYAIDAIGVGPGQTNFDLVLFYCGLMLVFYVLSSGLSYLLSVLMVKISQKIVYQMRKDLVDKLLELPVRFFDSHQTGDIISRLSYDIDTVNSSLSNDLLQIAASAITVIGSFIMMLRISPPLILVFVVTVPISVLFIIYRTKKVRPLFRKRSAKLGELNGFVEEIISGQKTTKAYHQEQTMVGRFDQRNNEAVEAYYMADYYGSTVGPSVSFINNLSLTLISIFGSLLYLVGSVSLGNLSSFVLYSRKFSGPVNEMANIISELQSAAAAAERVFRMIDEPAEAADLPQAKPLEEVKGDVQMKDIQFGYEPDKVIIHDLNLHAKPGSLVAIVGPTGAGKTTIINLLMRFYDPQKGQILMEGRDSHDITRKSLRAAYTMVLQDTWLFYGSIYDNIAFSRPDATPEEVIEAAKAAKIHNYIMSLPDGYDTIVNGDGLNISQGQKQMLTIARAMLSDAKMLILDEATSNVDTRTEMQIQSAMRNLMKDKTCFVIAHRLSTVQNADTILVVQHGDIIEQGNHEQLMKKGGVYAGLYSSQFH
ncbi:MAG: ABC transporter ATP-binding protein [Clostridium sp.]|nr:ABC transporter ATP-binding protein [Clostridium sp.]CDA61095.1 multidrug ABC transport system ATP-binding and permease protein [Clostridium sp. CAG:169]